MLKLKRSRMSRRNLRARSQPNRLELRMIRLTQVQRKIIEHDMRQFMNRTDWFTRFAEIHDESKKLDLGYRLPDYA